MYFFVIAYAGFNKNGNYTYRVTGFKGDDKWQQYIPLNDIFMTNLIGGRFNKRAGYILTTLSIEQIKEKLNNRLDSPYHYAILDGV